MMHIGSLVQVWWLKNITVKVHQPKLGARGECHQAHKLEVVSIEAASRCSLALAFAFADI